MYVLEQVYSQGEHRERVTAMEEFFKRNCCIQGYHVWVAVVEEALVCGKEVENASDRYTVVGESNGLRWYVYYDSHHNFSVTSCKKKFTVENIL